MISWPYTELKSIHRADLFPVNDDNVWKEGVNQIDVSHRLGVDVILLLI